MSIPLHLTAVGPADVAPLRRFLTLVDLTTSGLDAPGVRLWVERSGGAIVGSTGYERGPGGGDVLLRSVAVDPAVRADGRGTRLARFAMEHAAADGATTAWLFSRRSGPFWQGLGFVPADRDELARRLAGTEQVRLFRSSGQLDHEVAWSCRL